MNLVSVVIKSIVALLALFIFARIMGKKQISQLTFFDYIVGISIGSIAAAVSVEKDIPLQNGLSSMVVWTAFPLILSFIASKSIKARRLLDGTPTILIQNGKIIEKNLRKTRFTVNDLLEELRIKDVFNVDDVEFALLETSGKMSVLKKSDKQTVTNSDLKLPGIYQGLCANIIVDGKFMKQNIAMLKINEAYILNELKEQNISSIKNILLAYYDSNGKLHVNLKNNDLKVLNILH